MTERGFEAMAIETIALRAGAAKATIYKWWPDRATLAIEAFFEMARDELRFPETGDAATDFRLQIHALADTLRTPAGTAFVAMIAGARGDASVARAIGERWISPRRVWGRERLTRAIAERQARADLPIDAALTNLYSIVYSPLLLGRGVLPAPMLDECLDLAFDGIFVKPKRKGDLRAKK